MSSRAQQSDPPPLRNEVHAELGKCVLVYLAIETALKLYLPYVRATEDEIARVQNIDWRELLDSKATLGTLVKLLLERTHVEPRESFEDALKSLVLHRNELIHHFNDLPFAPLATDKECEAALEHLRVRKDFAVKWLEIFRGFASTLFRPEHDPLQ